MQFLAEQRRHDFVRGLGAHVQNLGAAGWKIRASLVEQTLHRARKTRGDFDMATGGEALERGIATGGHLAQISHCIEGDAALAKAVQDGLFDFPRNNLRVLAMAIENARGELAHGGVGTIGQFRTLPRRNRKASWPLPLSNCAEGSRWPCQFPPRYCSSAG